MRAFIYKLADYFALAGGVLLIAIILVTTTNVVAFALNRLTSVFGFNVPGLSGYEDFVRLAMSCAALMFFPLCQVKNGHVAVDMFFNYFPQKLQRLAVVTWSILTVILVVFLAYWMWIGLMESRHDNTVASVLGWPEWPFYIPGILSLILWGFVALVQVKDANVEELNHV